MGRVLARCALRGDRVDPVARLGIPRAGLSLLISSVTAVAHQDVATYALAAIGLVFCAGLAVINRHLHIDTSVGTPWKQSLYAVAAILVALALYGIG